MAQQLEMRLSSCQDLLNISTLMGSASLTSVLCSVFPSVFPSALSALPIVNIISFKSAFDFFNVSIQVNMNMSDQDFDDDMLEEALRQQAGIAMQLNQQNDLLQFQIDELEISTPSEPSDEQELLSAICQLQSENRNIDQQINVKTKELELILKNKMTVFKKFEDVKNKQQFFKMKNHQNKVKIDESNKEVVLKLSRQAYLKEVISSHCMNVDKMREQLENLSEMHVQLQSKLTHNRNVYKQLLTGEGSSTFRTY